MSEPGGGLKTVDQGMAGMSTLSEVSNEELGDGGIIIDDEKVKGIACYNFYT